ncbi:MAG TPA: ATP synthase subunit I [Acidimicrobiales bacterium]|nr:ATP synthase subunit I [Acidimicrobiales bacterium]
MFDRFSLPDVMAVSRRTMLMSLVMGIVGLVVLLLVSQPWAALGLCVGLGLGMLNFRAIQRSVVKVGERVEANKRRPLAVNTLGRMAIITVVALGLLFVEPPLGFGLLGGLALFQMILLANVTRSMLKMGSGSAIAGAVFGSGAPFDDDAIDAQSVDGPTSDGQPSGPPAQPGVIGRGPADGRGGS